MNKNNVKKEIQKIKENYDGFYGQMRNLKTKQKTIRTNCMILSYISTDEEVGSYMFPSKIPNENTFVSEFSHIEDFYIDLYKKPNKREIGLDFFNITVNDFIKLIEDKLDLISACHNFLLIQYIYTHSLRKKHEKLHKKNRQFNKDFMFYNYRVTDFNKEFNYDLCFDEEIKQQKAFDIIFSPEISFKDVYNFTQKNIWMLPHKESITFNIKNFNCLKNFYITIYVKKIFLPEYSLSIQKSYKGKIKKIKKSTN